MRWLLFALAGAALVAVAAARRAPPEAPHERWARGDCAACHADPERADGAPAYHGEPGWAVVHGRTDGAGAPRCLQCHTVDRCRDCHARAPDTHTPGFVNPADAGEDARRHAVLGRLRPSACLTCHTRPVADCVGCHVVAEVQDWAEAAATALAPWPPALLEGE